ncbi:MAG: HAMP domain-containing sensor histidine kinase [Gammaproteobacteria bacterium]
MTIAARHALRDEHDDHVDEIGVAETNREEIIEQIDDQRRKQGASLLRIYHYYRIVIGISLLVVFINQLGDEPLGALNAAYFELTVAFYIILNVLIATSALVPSARTVDHQLLSFLLVTADVIALTLLMHFSGGVTSGLGTLIIVSIAAGSILVTGRVAMALPAIATIAVLYEEFYLSLVPYAPSADYVQAGMLGVLYFGTGLAIQTLSTRLRRMEITSLARAAEVATLEQLNRLIIQRMLTGIIVSTAAGRVRLMNQAARTLMGLGDDDQTPSRLPAKIYEGMAAWQRNHDTRAEPFQLADAGPELRVNFSAASDRAETDVIVFLEDASALQQQAQQLKLASLGRLSGSIAHEIRNPLGAISHAAQLLKESIHLDQGDLRLADIIQNHSRRMNDVIENVLELSRRKAPSPERIPLKTWLDEFVREFKEANWAHAKILVEVEPTDVMVRIDAGQLTQVLTNLAQNGLRYSEKHSGEATLLLRAGIDDVTGRPYLHVVDDGPGVAPENVQNLFEPFYTTESTGTGLGLYISRELCEANQARLSYAPWKNGGSCFRITFSHPDRIPN